MVFWSSTVARLINPVVICPLLRCPHSATVPSWTQPGGNLLRKPACELTCLFLCCALKVLHSLIEDKTKGTQETSMKSPGQWTMKTSLSSIVLLAFFLSVHLGAASGGSGSSTPCCLDFNHKMLPWNWVYSYELVKDSCLQKVVIFTTKRGQKVCVQPQAKWVQRYISLLKAQKHL